MEVENALLEHPARRIDHVALGRADVHEQDAGFDQMANRLERDLGRGDRHARVNGSITSI